MSRVLRLLAHLHRRLLLHRRWVAGLLAGLAALLTVHTLTAPAPATVLVWTASHDLGGGAVLQPTDLRQVRFAPDSVPDGTSLTARTAVGRTLAGPMRRGEPLSDLRLVGPALTRAFPGRVLVPVRLADAAVADLLRPGDVIDVVSADPQGANTAHLLADHARVVAIPTRHGVDPALPGALVLLAVPASEALLLSAEGVTQYLSVVLNR